MKWPSAAGLAACRHRISIDERMHQRKDGNRNAQQKAQAHERQSHEQVQECDRKPWPRIFLCERPQKC